MVMSNYTRRYQTLISITLQIFHWVYYFGTRLLSISTNFAVIIQGADSNVKHMLDGLVYVLGRNMQNVLLFCFFYRKVRTFSVTNGFQPNIERLEM